MATEDGALQPDEDETDGIAEDRSRHVTEDESGKLIDDDPITYAALAVLGAFVVAGLSQVVVPYPLSNAPYDVATMGVYLAGLVLGPVWAAVSLGLYLLAFAFNLPYFGPPGQFTGVQVLSGPLGGYILAYPLAAAVVGGLVHRGLYPKPLDDVSIPRQVGALAVGTLLVYPVGAAWIGFNTQAPLGAVVIFGGLLFLPGEAVMALLALAVGTGGYYALTSLAGD